MTLRDPRAALSLLLLLVPIGCGGGDVKVATPEGGGVQTTPRPQAPPTAGPGAEKEELLKKYDTTIPMVTYAWDKEVGDKSVPPELGGPGFTGEGWQTVTSIQALGDPAAVKGGAVTLYETDWPATLRMTGKDWNSQMNYMIANLCFEGLVNVHPNTLEFMPGLASHWQISDDKMTYRYRINPAARWSDGSEVTSDDVVASYKLRMDPGLLDPSSVMTYGKLETPIAKSKYIVEVKVKEENWRNFLYFSGMTIFPAKEISIPAKDYLDKYQFAFTANTGPYIVKKEDIVTGESVTVRRRADWWDAKNPAWAGLHNVDAFKFLVVKDPNLAFEKAKKGEIDLFMVRKAQWWAEDVDRIDGVKRGLIQKKKIYSDFPIGTQGFALNIKRPPLDDIRVRKALRHLLNFPLFNEKFFAKEYRPLQSYYQGGTYQNRSNELVEYDELKAVELLEQAGFREIGPNGYRLKDGHELAFTLTYADQLSERYLTPYVEDCKKAGIKINLQLLTPATHFKNVRQKDYDIAALAWGALVFPNPETSFHSNLADQLDNNNVTGFRDPKVDELCAAYDKEYDVKKRVEIVRQIDGLVYNQYPYVLTWYNPSQRLIYWNKIRLPKWGAWRTSDYDTLPFCWWVDPEKEKELEAAKADPSKTMKADDEVENHFWEAWNYAEAKKRAGS
ncbi:MAG: ABC transporter substrate-binding protein [Acidobacteriota bacterium]